MEVIYQKACGIDVHKSFIVAVICDSTSAKPQYLRKRFSTFNNSLIEFRNWLLANDCQNVCMESTGKYYVPVYNALEGHISNVVVANPKWVRCIKGEKDDNKDAKWIADLFKLGIVRSSFIPDKDIRILRELTRYLYKLTNMRTSEKNRFTNALTVGNCKLDMVFSDIFGKSSSAIINTILSQNEYNDEDILKNIDKHCKSSNEDILNSISGISWETAQKQRMNVIQEHIDYLNKSNNYYAEKFNVISKRRGKKRAYIAIARKILVAIYHMLSTGEFFNPTDASKVETSDKDKIKFTKNNFMQSTKQLISLGLTVDKLQAFITSKISESTPSI